MMQTTFEDFYKVPNLHFDISKLRKALDIILKNRNFDTPGLTHFGAISLNQIPGDKQSIQGHNVRGK